ncbi:MAG: family 20 glycosylhydrolase [Verrucomicrobia bacterium]|nr:family 20 glycosylhydrolase [Verrucomicrobiota bacterium]
MKKNAMVINTSSLAAGRLPAEVRTSMRRTITLATRCLLLAAGLLGLAAAAPVGIYDRDTPFNGGVKAATPAGTRDPADTHPGLNLIPWPKSLALQPGQMDLTAASRIVAADASLKGLADILAAEIQLLTDLKLPVAGAPSRAGDIVLKLNPSLKADESILVARPPALLRTTDGAHSLTIGEQAVVEGFDYRAVAEGSATLLQAISQANSRVALPKLIIKDWPHADFCGMMVDCGRQAQPVEWLKRMVETCRMYKVRYLQLHLTDDQGWCFPSTKYPQLGAKPQGPTRYTLEELKDLVAYADARGIAIVPELEMPGHSGAALNCLPEVFDAINPETKQPIRLGCMNMASEEIYPALDTIIGEMCDVFRSSPYFHIGSDEVSMGRVTLNPGFKAFMAKHGLKSDGDLANHFIARVNEIVKKHGKKTIKWEGLGNEAAKDIIIMTWIGRSNMARNYIGQGYATITCPWDLEVPWEQWSMYECNTSKLKKGEAVLGAILVAWEASAEVNAAKVRTVAGRQERTWGPDNSATEAGFLARYQAQDAAVCRLIGLPPKPALDATFTASAGTRDLLLPVFAFDGNDATFHQSAAPPKAGDSFTVALAKPALVHAIEVLTGSNGRGLLDGAELQVSNDGTKYVTVATLSKGAAKAVLASNTVKAVRLHCATPQREPMAVREIKLQLMVELSGMVADPGKTLGQGSVGKLTGDTTFQRATASCVNPVFNNGFTLTFDSASGYHGPIGGKGTVEIIQGGADGKLRDAPMILGGKEPNTMTGTWRVKSGQLALAKPAGTDAAGGTIIVGGQAGLCWVNSNQLNDAATVELLDSPTGGATLNLNGCTEQFASLKMAAPTKIATDGQQTGGVLTVGSLTLAGQRLPAGVYTAADGWITGCGFVVVGDVKSVNASGVIDNPNTTIGSGNIAVLTAATTFGPATGTCAIPVRTGGFGLTFSATGDKPISYGGFITGNGGVTISAAGSQPLEITGPAASSYQGATVLTSGTLKLNKPPGVIAIPGNLLVGGATAATVMLGNDGQFAPAASVTLNGKAQPCYLDLAGHTTALAVVRVDGQAKIRTGSGGQLTVKQLVADGTKIAVGTHRAPQPWLEGSGSMTIDPRLDVAGEHVVPNKEIGAGNTANLTADTKFGWQTGTCDIDVVTNGHTLTIDSGAGNALCYTGSISGTGNVVLLMAPSSSHLKNEPLRLAGDKPNTSTGKFHVHTGRVQMEKPGGIDAISGDVSVGGQGFNDCLHWLNSNQIKDTATITLLNAGNNGAAYLSLNGCSETVTALVMAANTTVKTDSPDGKPGVLTVKSLTVNNVNKPAGTYTAATEKWLDGKGQIVVAP